MRKISDTKHTEKTQHSTRVLESQKRAENLKEQGAKKRLEFEKAIIEAGFNEISDFKIYKMAPEALETRKLDLNRYKQRVELLITQS